MGVVLEVKPISQSFYPTPSQGQLFFFVQCILEDRFVGIAEEGWQKKRMRRRACRRLSAGLFYNIQKRVQFLSELRRIRSSLQQQEREREREREHSREKHRASARWRAAVSISLFAGIVIKEGLGAFLPTGASPSAPDKTHRADGLSRQARVHHHHRRCSSAPALGTKAPIIPSHFCLPSLYSWVLHPLQSRQGGKPLPPTFFLYCGRSSCRCETLLLNLFVSPTLLQYIKIFHSLLFSCKSFAHFYPFIFTRCLYSLHHTQRRLFFYITLRLYRTIQHKCFTFIKKLFT